MIKRFKYLVIILKVETCLNDGMKFKLKVNNTIPFMSKDLAIDYKNELDKLGINNILIEIPFT